MERLTELLEKLRNIPNSLHYELGQNVYQLLCESIEPIVADLELELEELNVEPTDRMVNKLERYDELMPTLAKLHSAFCGLNTHQVICNYSQEDGQWCNCGVSDLRTWMRENGGIKYE